MKPDAAPAPATDAALDRRNGNLFVFIQLMTYFSAPVLYVGVVQAAFLDKLGTSATVANLPSSTYLLGAVVPLFFVWLFPTRLEQRIAVTGYTVVAASLLLVCAAVFFEAPNWVRIAAVIGQGLMLGVLNSVINIYLLKCLARGTTETGRARALKYAFGFGPVAAVLGSLLAQLLLAEKIPGIGYPGNFGVLYLLALPCMGVCALLARRFQLVDVPDVRAESFTGFLKDGAVSFTADHRLVIAWIAYLLWYCALGGMTNLSLYTREAVGRSPIELAGLIMALRFGVKAVAGFGIGSIAGRFGARSALIVTVVFVGLGMAWPFVSTGYGYLVAFGLMGAGELGGVYFTNYVISISSPAQTTRNMAILSLVGPVSSFAPATHGQLTDAFGFNASFAFGVTAASLALILLWRTGRAQPGPANA